VAENGRLRVYGQGDVEVDLIVAYLNDFRYAYNAALVFEEAIGAWQHESGYPFAWAASNVEVPKEWRVLRFEDSTKEWRVRRLIREPAVGLGELEVLVPKSEQLVLSGVALQSPGFWDFLGKLNPLEIIRQYLNDRHERRKDREYRESAEDRKLRLENLRLENEVIAGRIKIAKENGVTERDLAPLLNHWIYRPLGALDRHQDLGTISSAETQRGFASAVVITQTKSDKEGV
jgi:hypothetical protein